MQFLRRLGIDYPNALIDWEMTPIDTFAMFESRGGKELVRSTAERYYYFYVDNWVKPARLCCMERGIRYARVLARINAPQELIDACVSSQGNTYKEHSYAITRDVRAWLEENVLEPLDMSRVEQIWRPPDLRLPASSLSEIQPDLPLRARRPLRRLPITISEHEIAAIISQLDYFECEYNPAAGYAADLVDNADNLTVTDLATGLVWLRSGSDHGSRRKLLAWINAINRQQVAGYTDWRLPTVAEALSLLRPEPNAQGLHLDPCFTSEQGYIFTSDTRKPGGCWFLDLRQAKVFWAGGTLAGGFCRPCRTG